MTLSLRPPRPSDYVALASWIPDATQCARWAGPYMPFPFTGPELPALIARAPRIVASESSTSFSLVEESSESAPTLGFGQLVRQDRTAFRLARLIIAPGKRGCGLGAALCQLLIAEAESVPEAQVVKLFVHPENAVAMRLYTKLGFVEAPPHPRAEMISMQRSIERIDE
jgi:ribosomal-protein-alanine N-acetyltransferase